MGYLDISNIGNMRSDWKGNKNKIIVMLKRIFGILVGLAVTVFGMIILGNEKSLIGWLSTWYLPMFLGGITAGYFAHDKGWISGFVVAGIWVGNSLFYDLSGKAPVIHVLWYSMGLPVGAAGGYFGQSLAHITSAKTRRKIVAVIVGLCAMFVSSIIIIIIIYPMSAGSGTCAFSGGKSLTKDLISMCLPALAGGIFAGIVAQRQGWIYGFLSVLLLHLFGFLVMVCVGLGAPLINAFAEYEWSFIARTISHLISTLAPGWWLVITAMLSGILGGHLGQLLVQKRAKKKKVD